jgi:hypothetical protein
MGSFICKQPNGKYCRFSTVVDTLTHINMTEDEYIEYCVSRAVKDAIRDAKDVLANYVRPFDEVKKYFVPNNNTVAEFNELLRKWVTRSNSTQINTERTKKSDGGGSFEKFAEWGLIRPNTDLTD